MKLTEYLNETNQTVHGLAKAAGVTPSVVYKFIQGNQKSVKPHIARAISEATGGKVGILDLLFPDQTFEFQIKAVDK